MQDELSRLYEKDTFSKIISLDKGSKFHSVNYNRISAIALKGQLVKAVGPGEVVGFSNNGFHNIIGCTQFRLDEESLEEFTKNTLEMIEDGNHFLPIIEVPQEYSNLSFVVETNIKYLSAQFPSAIFQNEDVNGCIATICKRIYKELKVKLSTDVCVYIRAYGKKIYLKFHMLKFLMNYSNKVAIIRQLEELISQIAAEKGPFEKCWLQSFNELYETTAFPALNVALEHSYWSLYAVYECKNKFSVSVNPVERTNFISQLSSKSTNWISALSINDIPSEYIKEVFRRDVPEVKLSTETLQDKFRLTYEINRYHNIEFLNLVLKHLPEEYRRGRHLREIVSSLRLEKNAELLAKNFYIENRMEYLQDESSEIESFEIKSEDEKFKELEKEFYKLWNENSKNSVMGFYAYIAKQNAEFRTELNLMIERLVERFAYEDCGKLNNKQIASVMNYWFYGKFVTFDEIKGKTVINHRYMFVDRADPAEEKFLYKWARFENTNSILDFLTEEFGEIIQRVVHKLDNTGNTETRKLSVKDKSSRKLVGNLSKVKNNLGNEAPLKNNIKMFDRIIESPLFMHKINQDKGVIGVLNGVLFLDLDSDDPQPYLYQGYSPFVVTKSVEAEYVPYHSIKGKTQYLDKIKNAIREIFPDKESRVKFFYYASTGLDEKALKDVLMILIGWGGNGKSLIMDWILELLGDYGVKVSPKLITESPQGGKADPELMQLKGSRLAYAAETSRGDSINSARLKQITEAKKPGRELYGEMGSFESSPTHFLSTNFEMRIPDSDYGTNRRIMCLRLIYQFVFNPDPDNPHEKKIDTTLPSLLSRHPEAKTEFFSWLVHLRCKFQRKYKSVIHRVPSAIIDKDTNEYKCDQDTLSKFITTKLVVLYGYGSNLKLKLPNNHLEDPDSVSTLLNQINEFYEKNEKVISHTLTMDFVIKNYIEWSKRVLGEDIKGNYNSLLKDFLLSPLGKFINGEGDLASINGVRILEHGQPKLKGEVFVSCTRRS